MYKYLLIRDYMQDGVIGKKVDRKIFSTKKALLKYMEENINTIFNAGFHSSEIHLYRILEDE